MNAKLLLTVMLLIAARFAYAEGGTCPPGYYPIGGQGASGCAPIPNYDQSNTQAVPAGPRWKTTWGAFATDGENSVLGTSVGMRSKRQAEKAALAQCRSKGGVKCEVDLSFYNQCAVLVTGDRRYLVQGAATVGEASRIGISHCSKTDSNCHVYHSDCSLAERIQ